MFIGAYWSARRESEEAIAERMAALLGGLARADARLASWYLPGRSSEQARQHPLTLDARSIRKFFQRVRTDTDGRVIDDLGWRLSIWNGDDVGLDATLGMYAPGQNNSVVITFGPESPSSGEQEGLLSHMIRTLDPDHAVATSHELLDSINAELPWATGWITYRRGGRLRFSESGR